MEEEMSFKTEKQRPALECAISGCPGGDRGRLALGLARKNAAGPCSSMSQKGQRSLLPRPVPTLCFCVRPG